MARDSDYPDDMIVKVGEALQREYADKGITRAVRAGAIRERLGGGNHARIRRAWEAHLNGDTPGTAKAVQVDILELLPPEDRAEVAEAVEKLKGLLVRRLVGAKRSADDAAKRDIEVVERECRGLEAENEELSVDNASLRDRLMTAEVDLQRREGDLLRLRQEMIDRDRLIAALQAQARDATLALGAATEAREGAVRERDAAAEEALVARGEATGLRERLAAATAEAAALRAAAGIAVGDGEPPGVPQGKRSGNRRRSAAG